jgi:hypothetical protein
MSTGNIFKKIPLAYLVMIKFIQSKFNVSKLTPSDIEGIVRDLWIPELEANGFKWNNEDFTTLFFAVKLKNYYRRFQTDEAKELLELLEKKHESSLW